MKKTFEDMSKGIGIGWETNREIYKNMKNSQEDDENFKAWLHELASERFSGKDEIIIKIIDNDIVPWHNRNIPFYDANDAPKIDDAIHPRFGGANYGALPRQNISDFKDLKHFKMPLGNSDSLYPLDESGSMPYNEPKNSKDEYMTSGHLLNSALSLIALGYFSRGALLNKGKSDSKNYKVISQPNIRTSYE